MLMKQPNLERILQANYEKELSAINSLKTAKGKINRIDKILANLADYQNELESVNDYNEIVKKLKKLKTAIKQEQKAIISEKYQDTYQAAIADAEQIRANFESIDVERYQIMGEPDCQHYKICARHNNEVYPLSEHKIGVTAPPFHEQCTCTIVPYSDDKF